MSKTKNSLYLLPLFCLAAFFFLISCLQVNSEGQGKEPQIADSARADRPAPALPNASVPKTATNIVPSVKPKTEIVGCGEHEVELISKARGKTTHYYAFVPESQNVERRFPVLYLLHGAYDGYDSWKKHAQDELCDLAKKYALIIITPDGDPFGWYADSKNLKNNQIETYFIRELIPDVETKFPTNGKRGIAGLSMGGHGALVLALRGGTGFISISSMSGILDITSHPTNWKLPEVFGPYETNRETWESHSAYHLAQKQKNLLSGMNILVTVSQSDKFAYEDNKIFHQLLNKLGVKHTYQESPGNHDWNYWLRQLPQHVEFHAKYLNGENNAAPAVK